LKALGGDEVQFAEGTRITLPAGRSPERETQSGALVYRLPGGCQVQYTAGGIVTHRSESFIVQLADGTQLSTDYGAAVTLPKGARELVPGSSWGTFTIACTIPIALFMGLWMYKIRKGCVGEASIIGALAVLAAVVVGNWIPGSPIERFFSLTKDQTIL